MEMDRLVDSESVLFGLSAIGLWVEIDLVWWSRWASRYAEDYIAALFFPTRHPHETTDLSNCYKLPSHRYWPDTGDATWIVSQTGRAPAYGEGSLSYFDVRSIDSGTFKQERRLGGEFCVKQVGRCDPSGASPGDPLGFTLTAGSYEIRGFVRPCDGNCGRRNAPTDECRTTFTLKKAKLSMPTEFKTSGCVCLPSPKSHSTV